MTPRLNPYTAAPDAIRAMLDFTEKVEALGLERSLLHLIKLRASQVNGCAYCIDMHAQEARAGGETQQRLDTLQAWREVPFFDDRERAALGWTEALTRVADTNAPDDPYSALAGQFDEAARVAVTMAIIMINGWNRIAIGFRSVPVRRR